MEESSNHIVKLIEKCKNIKVVLPFTPVKKIDSDNSIAISQFYKSGHIGIDLYDGVLGSPRSLGIPIKSCTNGIIVFTQYLETAGNTICIHSIVNNIKYRFVYCHLQARENFKFQDIVSQGTVIGTLGSTGTQSTGPHLHLTLCDIRHLSDEKFIEKPADLWENQVNPSVIFEIGNALTGTNPPASSSELVLRLFVLNSKSFAETFNLKKEEFFSPYKAGIILVDEFLVKIKEAFTVKDVAGLVTTLNKPENRLLKRYSIDFINGLNRVLELDSYKRSNEITYKGIAQFKQQLIEITESYRHTLKIKQENLLVKLDNLTAYNFLI